MDGMRREDEIRVGEIIRINRQVASLHPEMERARLVGLYKDVYDSAELAEKFTVRSFSAPYVLVTRKADGKDGSLTFQHHPRFYFDFTEY